MVSPAIFMSWSWTHFNIPTKCEYRLNFLEISCQKPNWICYHWLSNTNSEIWPIDLILFVAMTTAYLRHNFLLFCQIRLKPWRTQQTVWEANPLFNHIFWANSQVVKIYDVLVVSLTDTFGSIIKEKHLDGKQKQYSINR